jgi:hypothetical protein
LTEGVGGGDPRSGSGVEVRCGEFIWNWRAQHDHAATRGQTARQELFAQLLTRIPRHHDHLDSDHPHNAEMRTLPMLAFMHGHA